MARHETPLTILIMGVATIAAFGGMVIWVSDTKPILRLPRLLDSEFDTEGFQARFLAGASPQIEVTVPPGFEHDDWRLRQVGLSALRRYQALHKRTLVRSCVVVGNRPVGAQPEDTEDTPAPRALVQTRDLAVYDKASAALPELPRLAKRAGLPGASFEITGLDPLGVILVGRAKLAPQADVEGVAHRLGTKVAVELLGFQWVSQVELHVETPTRTLVSRRARRR